MAAVGRGVVNVLGEGHPGRVLRIAEPRPRRNDVEPAIAIDVEGIDPAVAGVLRRHHRKRPLRLGAGVEEEELLFFPGAKVLAHQEIDPAIAIEIPGGALAEAVQPGKGGAEVVVLKGDFCGQWQADQKKDRAGSRRPGENWSRRNCPAGRGGDEGEHRRH